MLASSNSSISDTATIPIAIITRLLSHARRVSIASARSLTTGQLAHLFTSAQFARLSTLDLSFCATLTEYALQAIGRDALMQLRHVRLRGCRRIEDGAYLAQILPDVETLDLGWSGIRSLPGDLLMGDMKPLALFSPLGTPPRRMANDEDEDEEDNEMADWSSITLVDDDGDATMAGDDLQSICTSTSTSAFTSPPLRRSWWPQLRTLDLTGCADLARDDLTTFLTHPAVLPPSLQRLSLCCLTPVTLATDHSALMLMFAFVRPMTNGEPGYEPNALNHIDLSHCDGITLHDVTTLGDTCVAQRQAVQADGSEVAMVEIKHSAILESDTEAGYRRFVDLVTSAQPVMV